MVRVLGSAESPEESADRMRGAVFGLGRRPLTNSMRAQFGRCSFNKTDFMAASGFDEFEDGVVNIQMEYRLRNRNVFQVLNDAIESVGELLGIDSLRDTFDHVIFCFGWGTTTRQRGTEWQAFADINGYTSAFNSGQCGSLTFLMHEIGHNLGLFHSADDFIGDPYGDTTGVVSFRMNAMS